MTADNILLLATKCTVVAFHRETGARLWQTPLKSGWTSTDFVSLVSDTRKVFAYTKGEVFCLDLFTGNLLWTDGLSGMGFGIASLALPGTPQAHVAAAAEHLARLERARNDSNQQHNPSH